MAGKLEGQEPRGRLDVLGYNLSKRFVEQLEGYYGCPGMWDAVKEHVEDGIKELELKKVPESFMVAIEQLMRMKK